MAPDEPVPEPEPEPEPVEREVEAVLGDEVEELDAAVVDEVLATRVVIVEAAVVGVVDPAAEEALVADEPAAVDAGSEAAVVAVVTAFEVAPHAARRPVRPRVAVALSVPATSRARRAGWRRRRDRLGRVRLLMAGSWICCARAGGLDPWSGPTLRLSSEETGKFPGSAEPGGGRMATSTQLTHGPV